MTDDKPTRPDGARDEIRPFRLVQISEAELDELRKRLARALQSKEPQHASDR
jgi:hypothetical protein